MFPTKCNYAFFEPSYKDVDVDCKSPFATAALLPNLSIVALEAKVYPRKTHTPMERDQRNKSVVKVPECDILTVNMTPGSTCHPVPYRNVTPTSHYFPDSCILAASVIFLDISLS
ncbi:hypothetical protein AVEN_144215-1 [Araneus ventricosus]|uniref:Uncharacterized protein n=1 Tax=Araneus ventricosus TaxID=182803 RepID=A0A4Y2HU22_ARAVE|nr:hypothetical protein AVEN_144215-1 [Araneus ventricosus]